MSKITVSIHQPAYLPWLGYFDKMIRSDIFVFLDTVQFEKNSFINRNQILSRQGPAWLTIPVKMKGHTDATLKTTEIDNTQHWQKKHLKSIELNYKKAIHFDRVWELIKHFYNNEYKYLSDICFEQLNVWCKYFDITTTVVRASHLDVKGCKSELILNLCKHYKATHYLSGKLGVDYLNISAFKQENIDVEIQNFQGEEYPQLYGSYVPNLSVLDYAMNCNTLIV